MRKALLPWQASSRGWWYELSQAATWQDGSYCGGPTACVDARSGYQGIAND